MHVICAKRIDGYQLRQAFLSGACAEPATANQKMTEDFSDLHGISDLHDQYPHSDVFCALPARRLP